MGSRSPLSALRSPLSARAGLTLIEMLVALAVTLVMMAAVVNLFANLSGGIRNRRAMIEAGGQLRQVRNRLQLDLAGATCAGRTWVQPAENQGYIEYIEGQWNDSRPSSLLSDGNGDNRPDGIDFATSAIPSGGDPMTRTPYTSSLAWYEGDVTNAGALGDWDDVLALTVRSESEPFAAQVENVATGAVVTVESPLAEVVWYAGENPADDPSTPQDETIVDGNRLEPGMRRLYRRAYLIAPWLGPWPFDSSKPSNNRPANVSVRYDPAANMWLANTLGELSKREFRAGRVRNSDFPHLLTNTNSDNDYLVLSDLLAFDVRIYDAGAPLFAAATAAVLQPGDVAWPAAAATAISRTTPPASFGAYVDLGWAVQPGASNLLWPLPTGSAMAATASAPLRGLTELRSTFATVKIESPVFHTAHQPGWHPRNRTNLVGFPAVYDTWSFHYENDGINQDAAVLFPQIADVVTDQGTNGLDDLVKYDTALDVDSLNGAGSALQAYGVDDVGERETAPPYDVPLVGLQVRLRIYEPDARQVREVSVTQSFEQ
ncbi:MAG: prepilin-type N-terminal cleavage/methylation domain-containing protein [Pirellulales bacterium]|nr:prepilin-type N-terminal cleavage/methylation domain-containing protein [Pirellulales bacterium]